MLEIADRITVLRRGKKIETVPCAGATRGVARAARWSAARCCCASTSRRRSRATSLLDGRGPARASTTAGSRRCSGVSFDVRAGEIVGIAGVDGNGQTELIDAITGLRTIAERRGQGRRPRPRGTRARAAMLDAGVGHIPEDRQRRGLVLEFSIAENIALHDYAQAAERAVGAGSSRAASSSGRAALIQEFDVRGGGPQTRAGGLSGGNQQKVVAAREIARDPKVLIAAQPTRGLDVGAIEYLHRRLVEERDEGRAILLDLARARGDPVALRPHPRHLRGRDRRRARRRTSPSRRSASRCSAAPQDGGGA